MYKTCSRQLFFGIIGRELTNHCGSINAPLFRPGRILLTLIMRFFVFATLAGVVAVVSAQGAAVAAVSQCAVSVDKKCGSILLAVLRQLAQDVLTWTTARPLGSSSSASQLRSERRR